MRCVTQKKLSAVWQWPDTALKTERELPITIILCSLHRQQKIVICDHHYCNNNTCEPRTAIANPIQHFSSNNKTATDDHFKNHSKYSKTLAGYVWPNVDQAANHNTTFVKRSQHTRSHQPIQTHFSTNQLQHSSVHIMFKCLL